MRILVTGSRGFVGTWLVEELRREGHVVYGVDRVGWTPDLDVKDLTDLATPGEAEWIVDSVRPDLIVHLAARYGRLLCRDAPHAAVTDNASATTELAAAAAERRIPVLYASSSEVYGDHGTEEISEDSELRTPTTIYGLSKRWGEEACRLYLPPEDLLVVRMNMLYGPEQVGGYGRCSLATFARNAVRGEEFVVHRGTTRSWLYAADAVRALRLLIASGARGTFNLGNPVPATSMEEIGDLVVETAGSGSYRIEDPPENQIRHKVYRLDRLLGAIDFSPEVGLEEGIERTVEWARKEVEDADGGKTRVAVPGDHR